MLSTGVVSGLLGALSFGGGDFAGASAARRAGALLAVAGAHGIGLVALLVALAVIRPPVPGADAIAIATAAGVAGMVGLAALYRGMAVGSMGIVTAVAGAGSSSCRWRSAPCAASPLVPSSSSASHARPRRPLQPAGHRAMSLAAERWPSPGWRPSRSARGTS